MSRFTKYFKEEIVAKLFSSKKKIVKFTAICFVPFLYGFVCVAAFWDPVSNVGQVPMAIVDNSKRIDLAIGAADVEIDSNNQPLQVLQEGQTPRAGNKVVRKIIVGEAYVDATYQMQYGKPTAIKIKNLGQDANKRAYIIQPLTLCYSYNPQFSFIESFIKGWTDTKIEDSVISQNPNGTFNINVSEHNPLNNVSYFNNYNTSIKAESVAQYNPQMKNPVSGLTGSWNVTNEDYWLQIQIPGSFNEIFASTIASMYLYSSHYPSPEGSEWYNQLNELRETPLNIWTTFKKNFIFGQFMKVFNELNSSLIIDFYPRLIIQTIINLIQTISEDNKQKYIFTPDHDINIPDLSVNYHIGSTNKGEKESVYQGPVKIAAGESVVLRNDEFKDALLKANSGISEADKNKLRDRKTYEGNTTTLNDKQNDWLMSDHLSYIDLIQSIIKPIATSLYPQPEENASTYNLRANNGLVISTAVRYLENKMFLTELLELDANAMPKKPIINKLTDTAFVATVNTIIKNLNAQHQFAFIFSNNTNLKNVNGQQLGAQQFMTSQANWDKYVNAISNNFKHVLTNLIKQVLPQSYDAQAPPQNKELITSGVIGSQYSLYGIGLGQFFLFISIWVGVLMLTFVLDRKRRGQAAKPHLFTNRDKKKNRKLNWWLRFKEAITWYFSKICTMLTIVTIQVSILAISIYAMGYSVIGSTFWLLYLQLLFSGYVFAFFIGSLWMFFRDEVIGKFIAILFLIINLSAGWGTFPPSMQFPFFAALSYIAPFTYSIKNVGAIIYGIGISGPNWADQSFILQNIGISLIYVIIGLILGCFGSMRLTKMQFYGSRNKKKLAIALLELQNNNQFILSPYWDLKDENDNDDLMKYLQLSTVEWNLSPSCYQPIRQTDNCIDYIPDKKDPEKLIPVVNWDKMPYGYQKTLTEYYTKRFPYDPKFLKWSRKNPSFIELDDCTL